jgi:hypothetical protein
MITTPDSTITSKGEPMPFVARWSTLVSALIVEPSVKLVALTAANYRIYDGAGVRPSQQRVARQTSYDEASVSKAWAVLRAMGMAERDIPSYFDGRKRTSDEYTLTIPDDWRLLPLYGPGMKRFHCQHCGKAFNPRPSTDVREDGTIGYYLTEMVFCRKPGAPRKRADGTKARKRPSWCFDLWERERIEKCLPRWGALKGEAWKMLSTARGDDWPTRAEVKASEQVILESLGLTREDVEDVWAS